jgi:putative membrane protein
MKSKYLAMALSLSIVLCAFEHIAFAADENGLKPTSAEKTFVERAAIAGMSEINLGKIGAEKGESKEVRDFGDQMVKDHSKINDNLKNVARRMGVEIPARVDAIRQAKIDRLAKMSGAAFDKAYVKGIIKAHEMDIAAFERAEAHVKDEDLKKFIKESVSTMKDHLGMIRKFSQAK